MFARAYQLNEVSRTSHRPRHLAGIAFILALVALLVWAPGCVYVRPSDAALIDSTAANARAYSRAVQADPALPAGVRGWIESDARQWTYFGDWANGRAPTTQPSPATKP